MPSLRPDNRRSWRTEMTGIIKIPLPPNWQSNFNNADLSPTEIVQLMDAAAKQGYLIGIEYAPNEKRFAVYAQGIWKDNPNAGLRTYSNAPTLPLALTSLFFKLVTMYSWGLWTNSNDDDPNMVT